MPVFVQVTATAWVNTNDIASIRMIMEDGVRLLILHAQDGTEVLVEGLWVGSVMTNLGISLEVRK